MEPKAAQELMQMPQFREFLAFMASEAAKLDTLDGIDAIHSSEIAVEVKSRDKAHKVLMGMIAPFANPQTAVAKGMDSSEYVA